MNLLVLDNEQAAALRGPTIDGRALNPAPTTDGRWALGLEVLNDDHGAANEILALLPIEDVELQALAEPPE